MNQKEIETMNVNEKPYAYISILAQRYEKINN